MPGRIEDVADPIVSEVTMWAKVAAGIVAAIAAVKRLFSGTKSSMGPGWEDFNRFDNKLTLIMEGMQTSNSRLERLETKIDSHISDTTKRLDDVEGWVERQRHLGV